MDLTNQVTDTVSLPLTHIDKVARENPLWLMALLVLYSETPWTKNYNAVAAVRFHMICISTLVAMIPSWLEIFPG